MTRYPAKFILHKDEKFAISNNKYYYYINLNYRVTRTSIIERYFSSNNFAFLVNQYNISAQPQPQPQPQPQQVF